MTHIYVYSANGHAALMPVMASGGATAIMSLDPLPSGATLSVVVATCPMTAIELMNIPGVELIQKRKPLGAELAALLGHLPLVATSTLEDVLAAAHAGQKNNYFHPVHATQ